MKINRKKLNVLGVILIICIILIIYVINNVEIEKVNEIRPEEEISKEDEEKISIVSFFYDKEKKVISSENKSISRELVKNDMYINILKEISKENKEENIVTLNEIINLNIDNIELQGRIAYIKFFNDIKEFESLDIESRNIVIEIIKRTLLEINEIENIKIYFNGIEYVAM